MWFNTGKWFGWYEEETRLTRDWFGWKKREAKEFYIWWSTYNPSLATNNIETIFHRETWALWWSGTYLQQDVRDRLNETFDNERPNRKNGKAA